MILERTVGELLPEAVAQVLDQFRREFDLDFRLWFPREGEPPCRLHPRQGGEGDEPGSASVLLAVPTRAGADLVLELRGEAGEVGRAAANALRGALEHLYEYAEEIRFFTYEVSERYEEINLLYSISETLGSLLTLNDAARLILAEVCDVMGARRGSLWVHDPHEDVLRLVASVGKGGVEGPLSTENGGAVTSQVFRDGRPLILTGNDLGSGGRTGGISAERGDSVLSVPVRYTPPSAQPRTVGVINLIGRRHGGKFTASDQKLLAAIASQVGAALENNRLLRESLEQERVSRELELAHDLQMKLLPAIDSFDPERVAARVEPAESVGGDFYHFLRLPGGRFGAMIGDVSSHGFPAALIMALAMSAATIYASEADSPELVLSRMGEALRDELENTEMYLTLFYGVLDPELGQLEYANAGHPHAFIIRGDGSYSRLEAGDPPMGIAEGDSFHRKSVPWHPGEDLVLLFTDGLPDTLLADSRSEGEERMVEEAARLRGRPAREIVSALFALERRSDGMEGDDRTAIVLRL
jgi:phosphoserine phosphatase RsbU/P